jgi:hypothetical protein
MKSDNFTQNAAVFRIEFYGREALVLREKVRYAVLTAETLDSCLVSYEGCNDIAFVTSVLLPDDEIIPVKYVSVDHTAALDLEHETFGISDDRSVNEEAL